jgi:hypothetical protein
MSLAWTRAETGLLFAGGTSCCGVTVGAYFLLAKLLNMDDLVDDDSISEPSETPLPEKALKFEGRFGTLPLAAVLLSPGDSVAVPLEAPPPKKLLIPPLPLDSPLEAWVGAELLAAAALVYMKFGSSLYRVNGNLFSHALIV